MITLFNKLTDTKTKRYITLQQALDGIKNPDSKIKNQIQHLRTANKESQDELKKQLPLVLFGGKFSERRASALIEYSRIICLDFDKIECLEDLEMELQANPYILACWRSPSNLGIKALVQVSTDNHLAHATALLEDFPLADPNAIKDVCRATFLSWDTNLYQNPNAQIYDRFLLPKYSDEEKYNNLKKWLENKGSKFVNGQRNSFVVKLAAAANRFGVNREFLKQKIFEEFLKGSDFSNREMEAAVNGMYDKYAEQHGTVVADEVWTDSKVNEVLSAEVQPRDIIYLKDVRVDIVSDYEKGVSKGATTYFESVDKIFRRVPGQLNVLSGIGNHGKSSWQQQMDIVDAVKTGGKFAYFGPEGYPAKRWYNQIIQTLVGKSTHLQARNRMSRGELERAMDFVDTHFLYVYPPEMPTPEYMIERFVESIIKHQLKGVTIDPWNQLLHSMQKRDDVYLAEALTKFERFAQQYQVLLTIITHPNRTGKKEDGNYEAPDVYDLNGGPVWNARSTNIYTYHRPYYSTNPNDPTCELIFRKIKDQSLMGVPGTVTLDYDRETFRFYDNGYNPLTNFEI